MEMKLNKFIQKLILMTEVVGALKSTEIIINEKSCQLYNKEK